MIRFSANLGFLWADRPLPAAIRAAAAAGFDAVEMHWPYATPAAEVAAALAETGLPLLSLNTVRGDAAAGEMGLSALPGREAQAREAIDQAMAYAAATGCAAVHVMAGRAEGSAAEAAFLRALSYAADAAPPGVTVLIEALNRHDAPGCFLRTPEQGAALIGALGRSEIKLMLDLYHAQIMGGDVSRRLEALLPVVGHVQIAGVPDRGPPDRGELDYGHVLGRLAALGWDRPVGAEYKPGGPTEASLGWMARLRGG